jgi:hypothetical protein
MCDLINDFTLENLNNIIVSSIVDNWNSYKIDNSAIDIHDTIAWNEWISWFVCVMFDPLQFNVVNNYNIKNHTHIECDVALILIDNIKNCCLHNIIEYIQLLYTHHKNDGKFAYLYFKKSWNAYYYNKYIYGVKLSKRRLYFIMRHYAYSYSVYTISKNNHIRNTIIVNVNSKKDERLE